MELLKKSKKFWKNKKFEYPNSVKEAGVYSLNSMEENKEDKEKQLIKAISDLTRLVDGLRSRRYLSMADNPKKFLFYNFISGIFSGIGVAIGATIMFGVITWFLSKMQLVPIFGGWAVNILNYIQQARGN